MAFTLSLFLLVGLVMGSFLSALTYRLPRHEDVVWERSRCPVCAHPLQFFDLVPLFSWIGQGGRCRYCKTRIALRYPLIELATASLMVWTGLRYGVTVESAIIASMTLCLIALIVTDFEHYLLPLPLLIALAVIGGAYSQLHHVPLENVLLSSIISYSIGRILYHGSLLWKKQESLGLGDVTLFGIAGIYLSPLELPVYFLLSGVLGIVTGLCWQLLQRGRFFPFGPAMAVSLWVCMAFPHLSSFLINKYLMFP